MKNSLIEMYYLKERMVVKVGKKCYFSEQNVLL